MSLHTVTCLGVSDARSALTLLSHTITYRCTLQLRRSPSGVVTRRYMSLRTVARSSSGVARLTRASPPPPPYPPLVLSENEHGGHFKFVIRKVREWAASVDHPRVQQLFAQIPAYSPEDPGYQV